MTATLAPTQSVPFVQSLQDPTRYVVRQGVRAFCPHERTVRDSSGQPVRKITVTDQHLPLILQRIQNRELERDMPVAISLGHTLQGASEEAQPEIIGWGTNWRYERFGPKQIPVLVYDEYVRREDADRARGFPFRSVEFYPDSLDITRVALLRRDPQLDLGVNYESTVLPAKHGTYQPVDEDGNPDGPEIVHCVLIYQREVYEMDMPGEKPAADPTQPPGTDNGNGNGDDMAKLEAMISQHPVLKYLCQKFAAEAQAAGTGAVVAPAAVPPVAAPAAAPPTPPVSSMAMPGATNMTPPTPNPMTPAVAPPGPDAERMAREQLQVQYARLQQQMDVLLHERETARAEQVVMQLEMEGWLIPDRAAEVQRMAKLGDSERQARANEIRTCYRRDPGAGPMLPQNFTSGTTGDNGDNRQPLGSERWVDNGKLTKAGVRELLKYQRENNIDDYDVALQRFVTTYSGGN